MIPKQKTAVNVAVTNITVNVSGIDNDALNRALQEPPTIGVRLNKRKPIMVSDGSDGLQNMPYEGMTRVSWCDSGYYLSERPVFTLNPLLHAGAFYVQDPSSMVYQQLTEKIVRNIMEEGKNTPPIVLDFCAAPGGKTTAIINALPDDACIIANEYVPVRGKILRENLEKWGFPSVITTGASADEYAALGPTFDLVTVDAPCSGEGMMRKDEEARRQWSEKLVSECATLQRDILSKIVNVVKPGGWLVYSTCTFNRRENEDNVRFIIEELGMLPQPIDSLNLTGIENVHRALDTDLEALRFMPHISRGEGLFVSVFRRPLDRVSEMIQNDNYVSIRKVKNKGGKGTSRNLKDLTLGKEERAELLRMFSFRDEINNGEMDFELSQSLITALPKYLIPLRDKLRDSGIRVTGAGLPVAELKGKNMIPDSRIVLNTAFNRESFPEVPLSEEDALKFLHRESFPLPGTTHIPKGYVTVTYKGTPLGLMKNLGNRANNMFPTPWRIRMS